MISKLNLPGARLLELLILTLPLTTCRYVKTRSEQETNQMKAYHKQQDEIAHIKRFIASAGTYANLVKQAKSRQKILDKMEADGLIEQVVPDRVFTFRFADVEKLPPPVLS